MELEPDLALDSVVSQAVVGRRRDHTVDRLRVEASQCLGRVAKIKLDPRSDRRVVVTAVRYQLADSVGRQGRRFGGFEIHTMTGAAT